MTPQQVVVTDTNILVNLAHAGRLALLDELLPYQFVLPVEVLDEIKDTQQLAAVNGLLVQGVLTLLTTMSISQLSTYANLKSRMGSGEAACIAWARAQRRASSSRRSFPRGGCYAEFRPCRNPNSHAPAAPPRFRRTQNCRELTTCAGRNPKYARC